MSQPPAHGGTPGAPTGISVPPMIPVSVPPMIPYEPGSSLASGTGITTASPSSTGTTAASAAVPVFDGNGGQVGVAVTNPATGTVELVGPGGAILGVIEPRDGAVDLIGADGTVTGAFSLSQATGQVILSAGGDAGAPTVNGTTTATTTGATTPGAVTTGAVPVFDASGIQIGLAIVNPATSAVDLVGLNGTILGVITQQNGAFTLVGAGGAVLGSFGVNQATGQVLFLPTAGGAGAGGSATGTPGGASA